EVEGLLPEVQRVLQTMGNRVNEQLQVQRRDLRALAETVGDIERRVGALEEATPIVEEGEERSTGENGEERSGEGRIHVIESGDTFSGLARQYEVRVQDLEEANPGVNPNRLQIGQEIQIP
ncbi:MAG: LysM peptidoglycan-binding domain-containing protein, partial [Opitutales bacterium]|nr:LysM peptidoglycan-binding domain-containing protein [Opitutales bacterium]